MATYYFDNIMGDDSDHTGLSAAEPYKTITKLNTLLLNAGDTVKFRRTSIPYYGWINLTRSGSSGNPITFDAYGDDFDSDKPILSNPNQANSGGTNIMIFECNASYITIKNIEFRDTVYAAILQYQTKSNLIVQSCRFTKVSMGIRLKSSTFLIENCEFIDLDRMARDLNDASDYGGVAISLEALTGQPCAGGTIRYNYFLRCRAPSQQFTVDGGAIEFFRGCSDINIYGNWIEGCKGVLELGGSTASDSITNVTFYNNVCVRNYGVFMYWNDPSGGFAVSVSNMKLHHNTIVGDDRPVTLIFLAGAWGNISSMLTLDNNIFVGGAATMVKMGSNDTNIATMVHRNNVWYRTDGNTTVGMTLDASETYGSPLFESLTNNNFKLTASSPAKGFGRVVSGYSVDFEGKAVNSPADSGALQYKAPAPVAGKRQVGVPQTRTTDYANYGIATSNDIEGGLHHLSYISQMYNIPSNLRRAGMLVAVGEKLYRLLSDLVTWVALIPSPTLKTEAPYCQITYSVASGTAGGAGTADTYVTRPLNTIVTNFTTADTSLTDVSLASNQFVVPAGVYWITAQAVCNKTNATRLKIQNITDTAVVVRGYSGWAPTANDSNTILMIPRTRLVLAKSTTLELQQIVDNVDVTNPTFEFGRDTGAVTGGDATNQIYAMVLIEKVR